MCITVEKYHNGSGCGSRVLFLMSQKYYYFNNIINGKTNATSKSVDTLVQQRVRSVAGTYVYFATLSSY